MRLPHVRFTVGTLLFTVAVVAANCWVFRPLYEEQRYVAGKVSYRVPSLYLGLIPLVNVAVVGTWLFVASRLRSLRCGHVAPTRSPLSGVTYFGLSSLVLMGLVHHFVPGATDRCWMILEIALGGAAMGWDFAFGEPGKTIPWMIFACSLYGLIISGPPLILSGVGQILARRCATTLPQARFRAMAGLVALGFGMMALAICLTPQPFEDEQEILLDFQVIDEVSRRPIAAAFVCLTHPFSFDSDPPPSRALTDLGGHARLRHRFVASGHRNAFQTMGVFSPWGRWLEISAANHRTRRIPLTDVMGPFADPVRPVVSKVSLVQGETPEDSFRGVAGHYVAGHYSAGSGGFGGRWLEIESDGRFAWCEWGCTSRSEEYGYLKLNDGEIELVPVPHPGRECDPLVTSKYRAIEWGDRLYLSVADERELQEFCRQALTPNSPSKSEDTYGSYLRSSDRDKSRSGLPRLPSKVWLRFLVEEMNVYNEGGALRHALNSLVSLVPRKQRALTAVRQP